MKIIGLTKKYSDSPALDGIDIEIEKGKITAILGESGAGKTTFLNAVAGLTDYEGKIEETGKISYLFQNSRLLPHLTAEGNVNFVLKKEERGATGEMLARVGLAGKEKRDSSRRPS